MKDNIFTGQGGYPFKGDLSGALNLASFEAHNPVIETCRGESQRIFGPYTSEARALLYQIPLRNVKKAADIGARIGYTSLEAFRFNQNLEITALEKDEGLLALAKYNFHKMEIDISQYTDDTAVKRWLDTFRGKSKTFSEKISFVQGDIEDAQLPENSYEALFSNQSLHWKKEKSLIKSFENIRNAMTNDGRFAFMVASHFLEDKKYSYKENSFRFNKVFLDLMDAVGKRTSVDDSYLKLEPEYDLSEIRKMAKGTGLKICKTVRHPYQYQSETLMDQHFPGMAREYMTDKISDAEKNAIINDAKKELVQKSPLAYPRNLLEMETILVARKVA